MVLEFRPGIRSIVRPSAKCLTLDCGVCHGLRMRILYEGKTGQSMLVRPHRVFVEPSLDCKTATIRDIVPYTGPNICGRPIPVRNGHFPLGEIKELNCEHCGKRLPVERGLLAGHATVKETAPSSFDEKPD